MICDRVAYTEKDNETTDLFGNAESGFIGLLLSVVSQFGVQYLVSWQTWSVFGVSLLYLLVWKKDVVWLILGTIGVLLLLF